MKRFGEKLRVLRKRRGLTMEKLGAMLEVNYSFISQLERSKRTPNAAMILKIADVFDISLDKLMRDNLEID